jgi:pyroglutamyl-peptidase
MTRVLLTSFEPFGGHGLNSSLEVGRRLARRPLPGVELHWLTLPVVAGACVRTAWEQVDRLDPEVVLALGQAAGAAVLRVEDRAVNVDHFTIPDNAGNQPRYRWIVPGAPPAYRASVPHDDILEDLRRAGVPAEHSFHAGTYVCNHLFYGLLHHAAVAGRAHQTGFLHLPLLPQQVPAGAKLPSRPLDLLVEGVRWAMLACAAAAREPLAAW